MSNLHRKAADDEAARGLRRPLAGDARLRRRAGCAARRHGLLVVAGGGRRARGASITEREESDARADRRPPAAAIVLIGGNARTFLCTFQLLLERLVLPLDPERRPHPGADVFAFLKTVDPGPKNQTGRDHTYPDVSKAALRAALATYPHVVGSTIVMEPACQGACLLAHHVRCRERFTGFLSDPGHLARATAFVTGLEFLGKELEALEDVRGRRYAVVAWMRPDVVPSTEGWPAWTALASGDDPALQRRCGGDVDMGRVMIRGDADRFLRHPAQILRDCALGGGNEAEDIVRHSAPPPPRHGCTGFKPLRHCHIQAAPESGEINEAWGLDDDSAPFLSAVCDHDAAAIARHRARGGEQHHFEREH